MIVQRKIKSQLCIYTTFDYEMAQQSTASWKLLRPEKVLESFFCIEDGDVFKKLLYTVSLYQYTCFESLHSGYQPSA